VSTASGSFAGNTVLGTMVRDGFLSFAPGAIAAKEPLASGLGSSREQLRLTSSIM